MPPLESPLSATVLGDEVTLNWESSYLGFEGFVLERAPDAVGGPVNWTQVASFAPASMFGWTFEDKGLPANSTVWYRLRGYNWVGSSPYSYVSVFIGPPVAPINGSATIGRSNDVDFIWFYPVGDQDGFKIERTVDRNGVWDPWVEIATVITNGAGSFGYSDSGTTRGGVYQYRVRAYNVIGTSPASDAVRIEIVPPDAPTSLAATPFADKVTLSWFYNHAYYGHVDEIQIERAPGAGEGAGPWTLIAAVDGDTTQYVDRGRLADDFYSYRVRVISWPGPSAYTHPVEVTTHRPAPPGTIEGVLNVSNQVTVLISMFAELEQDGYFLERAPDDGGAPGDWNAIATVIASNQLVTIFNDTNVVANTTNWYRARSFNGAGISDYNEPIPVRIIPPAMPTWLLVSPFKDKVDMAWTSYPEEVSGYKIQRAPDVGGSPGTWTEIARIPANPDALVYRHTDSNLVAGVFWYRVSAFNWVGDSPFSATKVTVSLPNSPFEFRYSIGTNHQVEIFWMQLEPLDADGFWLERASDAGGVPGAWNQIAVVTNRPSHDYSGYYSDTNVTANTTNWYRARSYNVLGSSGYSAPFKVRIVPPPAPNYFTVSSFANSLTATWKDDYPNYGKIAGFKIDRAPNVAGAPGFWTQVATYPPPPLGDYGSHTDTNLSANASFWYRVHAYNWVGEGEYAAPLKATVVPPGVPFALTVSTNSGQSHLSWSPRSPYDQHIFQVEWALSSAGPWGAIAVVPATNAVQRVTYSHVNPAANTTNWYRVRAVNMVGTSDYTPPAGVFVAGSGGGGGGIIIIGRPRALAPNAFRVEALTITINGVLINWSSAAGSTHVVEAANNPSGPFVPISPELLSPGGTASFLDAGAMTNSATRFYRIRRLR
jgi:hypothetical protein